MSALELSQRTLKSSPGPLISIITVNLNNRAGLDRTVRSLEAQTYGNWLHIIQDGGSTDGSVGADVVGMEVRRLVQSREDTGIYDAMNRGIERSRGELVWFLNSGDEFAARDSLESAIRSWLTLRWKWAYGPIAVQTPSSEDFYVHPFFEVDNSLVRLGLETYPHPGCIFERDLVLQIGGFNVRLGTAADQEFCLRAEQIATPIVIPRVLAIFESGGASSLLTHRRHEDEFRELRAAADCQLLGVRWVDSLWTYLMLGLKRIHREHWVAGVLRRLRPQATISVGSELFPTDRQNGSAPA